MGCDVGEMITRNIVLVVVLGGLEVGFGEIKSNGNPVFVSIPTNTTE